MRQEVSWWLEDFYDAPIAQEALDAARQLRDFVQAGLGP